MVAKTARSAAVQHLGGPVCAAAPASGEVTQTRTSAARAGLSPPYSTKVQRS
jgi:hypothetical protein